MNTPMVEGAMPSWNIDVNYGPEGFDDHETVASMTNATWRRAVAYAPAAVAPPKTGWFKKLRRKPTKSLYQAGPLLIAISTTAIAASRPVIHVGAGTPIKPSVTMTHVLPETSAAIEMRGRGRDLHGVIPSDAVSAVSGPRGHTVDDWDF